MKPDERQPVQASARPHGLPEPVALVAWNGSGEGSMNLASDSDSFEAFLPREPHGVAMGIAAIMAAATPTPVPPAGGVGCHRWRYALRWEQPARLAILKNVLGNSVTTYTGYTAPGSGNQNDWPDPITYSEIAGAWKYTSPTNPNGPFTGLYDHDCGVGLPACAPPTPTDVEGEQPGIYYSKGTWDWPDPNAALLKSVYDPAYPPLYHPGVDTTNACKYEDTAIPPAVVNCGVGWGYGTAGTYDGWAWTLNYGYAAAPTNDIVYGPDPGPPLALMDETTDMSGDSIPGTTGTPISFPTTWTTRGGAVIGAEIPTPKPTDPNVIQYAGLHQPSWTQNVYRDVVGTTKDVVNWGLMTFATDGTGTPIYNPLVNVVTIDTGPGDVTAIEGYMRLSYFNSAPYPGLAANGGTPTAGAIAQADTGVGGLTATWNADPKQACNRAYGVILCTDGQSNITNTGNPADTEWDSTSTPCTPDTDGSAFGNFPPGAAEAAYLDAHQAGVGDAVVRARTFAIGISSDISRCELNRTAYRGRTDANAKKKDAGFVLYDITDPPVLRGDIRLPHINPAPETAGTTVPTDESGPGTPPVPNRYGPDQTPPDNKDYAFFASDARALYDAFLAIVRGSASGDYTTSSPVSGAAVSLGSTVVLTSATYPLWQGHIKAKDTTNPLLIVDLWDAGAVLTTPDATKPWQPTPATRQLYTWDPVTGALIAVVAGNAGNIDALCGSCGITPAVVDFMRGNDGTQTNTARNWLLGPSINVTPAILGPAFKYFQPGNVTDHKPFEAIYANRRALAWLGADDGFLHAFDLDDGAEVLGLLPPNLIANQITLYNTFLDPDPQVSTDTGQNAGFTFDEHTWGVASSLRCADVWFGAAYKTVGFLTEGPGGDLVAAIDITHPYPGRASTPAVPKDPNYDPTKPVEILWTKNSSDYAGLFGGWSVPAVANDTFITSKLTFGAGINPTSLYNAQQPADIFVVDPSTGALLSTTAVAPLASPSPLVGHQTFTDSIIFQTNAAGFQYDNLANLSLQGDENGRVDALWGNWAAPTSKVLIDLNAAAGGPQPLYYSPAANGIGTLGFQVYALGSGSFYETSPTVSGWNVNRTGSPPAPYLATLPVFVPTLFVATNPYKITDALFGTTPLGSGALAPQVISKVIGGETTGIPLQVTDPTYIAGVHTRLGIHTQVTSSPLLVGNVNSTTQDVFFTVFDPDFGCNGYSYVIKVEFAISGGSAPVFSATNATTVYAAGAGAASGFVVTDNGAFVGQSGVGKNQATLVKVDIPKPSLPGAPNFRPVWWKEQR